jgi:ribosomal protein L44E
MAGDIRGIRAVAAGALHVTVAGAVVECTIPPDMAIERWRRLRRSTATTQRDPWSRLLAAARRVARHGERPCDQLHDTVSRYDHAAKRLELLLTCPVCETEKVMYSLVYEPRFDHP